MRFKPLLKYVFALLATLFVVGLYHYIDIRAFNLDVTQVTREHFFRLASSHFIDESIIILNHGTLEGNELREKIDSVLALEPAVIGINPCHMAGDVEALKAYYRDNKRVIFAGCSEGEDGILSSVIEDKNLVLYFKHDHEKYFEYKVDFLVNPPFHREKIAQRKNNEELINYVDARRSFNRNNLSDISLFVPDFLYGNIVLIGFLGDMTSNENYFDDCRVTPMNKEYGNPNVEPDMYDIEISAVIIRQLYNTSFLNEIGQLPRVLILLSLCVVNVLLLTFIRTRWLAVNIIISFVLFMFIILSVGWVIVYSFVKGYYVNLDELPLLLLITTVFTVGLAFFENRREEQSAAKHG